MTNNKPTPVAAIISNNKRRFQLNCDPAQDRTRQEFKADTDVNTIIKRAGMIPPGREPLYGGHHDFDLTLQEGIAAVNGARQAWARIPFEIRKKYPTWEAVTAAISKKELEVKGGRLGFVKPAEPTPPTATPAVAPTPPQPPK